MPKNVINGENKEPQKIEKLLSEALDIYMGTNKPLFIQSGTYINFCFEFKVYENGSIVIREYQIDWRP